MADPQGAMLGNAHGYVDIDISGVERNLNQAKGQFNNFINQTGSMMQSWGNQIAGFGQNLMLWTAPVALAVGTGLNVAADFDSVLTEIQARTGLTAEAMEQVRQTALQLGADTAFSSQQAADAFLNLLTAGLSVEDSLATLPQVLTAAAAGGMDLGTAADLTTSIMASFNLTAQDSTAIIDAMSRASAASPASMSEIGIAMKDVGGLAQMFNLSLDQTAAVLAIFAQNGIRGAEAGTQLRSLLLNLSSPTEATAKAWAALGTSLYNADGTMRNLDDVLADIRVGLERLPVEQQNEIISQLAGSYGIVGFNALLASDGIGAMEATMADQAAAADVAAAMMDTFKMTIDSLMGTIETFWITVLTPFMNNVLKPLANQTITVINAMTAWAAANEPLVQTIMSVVAAVIALGPTLFIAGRALQFVGFIISAISSPLTLLIGLVAGLVYLFRDQLWNAISGIVAPITEMFAAIGAGVPILDAFQHMLYDIAGPQVAEAFASLREIVTSAFVRIQNAIRYFFLFLNNGVDTLTAFKAAIGAVFGTSPEVTSFFNSIFDGISAVQSVIGQWIGRVQSVFNTFFRLLNSGQPILFALKGAFFEAFGNTIWFDRFVSAAQWLADMLTGIFGRISLAVMPAFEQIGIFIQRVFAGIQGFFDGLSGAGQSTEQSLDPIVRFLSSIGETIMTSFEGVMRFITVFFRTLNQGSSLIFAFWSALYDVFGPETAGQIQAFVFGIGQAFNNFVTGIVDGFMAVWNFLQPIFVWFAQNVTFQDLLISIGIALAALNAPLIAAGLAFVALVAAVSMLRQAWETNWGGIQDKTAAVLTTIGQLSFLIPFWLNQAAMAASQFGILVSYWMNQASVTAQMLWTLILWAFGQIAAAASFVVWALIDNGFGVIVNWLSDNWGPAWQAVIDFFNGLWNAIVAGIQGFQDGIWAAFQWIQDNVLTPAKTAWDGVVAFFVGLWTSITGGFEAFKTGIQAAFQWVADNVITPAQTAWNGLVSMFTGFWGSISAGVEALKTGLSEGFNWIKTNVIDPIVAAVQGLLDMLGNVGTAAQTAATTAGTAINNATGGNAGNATFGVGGQLIGQGIGAIGHLFGFADGINYVPEDMIALIHAGERVQRANENPYNPNAQNGMSGGIHIENINVAGARNYNEALEVGRGVGDGIKERLRQMGGARS